MIYRTPRLCYSAAINQAKKLAGEQDWYIVLSNDVGCIEPFYSFLANAGEHFLIGPQLIAIPGISGYAFHLQGWCVCIPSKAWDEIGDWDEKFKWSSWEDVDYSLRAVEKGWGLKADINFPFYHREQEQRFTMPDADAINIRNFKYLMRKHDLYQSPDKALAPSGQIVRVAK